MTPTLSLGDKANMQTIAAAWSALTEALDAHDQLALDVSALVDVDLTLLQLVEAGRQQAAREHKVLALVQPANAAVTALLERAGFLADPSADTLKFWFHGDLPK